jgi:hypothetical protein
MAHWLTNRGKLLIVQGQWVDAGAGAIAVGLVNGSAIPATMDSEAEIQDLNTVGELLALAGVDEPTQGWYVRKVLANRSTTEDDANNRINADADDVVWTAATPGGGETHVCAGFSWDLTVDTNDTTRLLLSVFTFTTATALNGSDLTLAITDFFRAT